MITQHFEPLLPSPLFSSSQCLLPLSNLIPGKSPQALWPAVGRQETNRWPKSLRTLGTRLTSPPQRFHGVYVYPLNEVNALSDKAAAAFHGILRLHQEPITCLHSLFSADSHIQKALAQERGLLGGSDELVSSADSRFLAIVTSRQSKRSHANDFRKWRTCRCLCHHFKLIFLC